MVQPQLGGLVSASPVCWVSGGRRVIVGFGNALTAYILDEHSKPRPTASFQGHESRVVAVVPIGPLRVASASIDGTVRVWGVEDGSLLRTIDFGHPILSMVAVCDGRIVVASATKVYILTLQQNSLLVAEKICVLNDLRKSERRRVTASFDGTVIATVGDTDLTLAFAAGDDITTVQIEGKEALSAVALSKDASRLAVGTMRGALHVYRDVSALRMQGGGLHTLPSSAAVYAKLHWHSFSVLSLRFSEFGNALYSGGCEGVLVVWKMTRTDFGKRNFKPRLSGAIWGVSPSPDESCIALTHADNSVRFLDALTLAVTSSLRGISTGHLRNLPPWDVPRGSHSASKILRLTPEPGNSGCVLVSGISNSVQLYDACRGAHVADLQIIPRNTVFRGKEFDVSDLTPDAVTIRHVAVSRDKKFLVSITRDVHPLTEAKAGANVMYMETLKFWNYYDGNGRIDLISRVDEPHGAFGETSAAAFHPSLPVVATASTSGTFKLWRAVFVEEAPDKVSWRCERTESYRESPCTSLSFSSDGSLLAVGCESSITLWSFEDYAQHTETDTHAGGDLISSISDGSLKLTFLHALVHPPAEELIGHVSFVADNSPLLLATTCHGLYLWDVLERCIWWSSRTVNRPECTVVDTSSGQFAVVVKMPSNHATSSVQKKTESTTEVESNGLKKLSKKAARRAKSANTKRQRYNGIKGMQCVPMDTAVALFHASSAIPISVTRLPTGTDVSGIAFLPDSRSAKSTSKAVVCFDTNMEIIRMTSVAEDEVMSNVTQTGEDTHRTPESVQGKAMLGELLGSSWRTVALDRDAEAPVENAIPHHLASTKPNLGPIRNAFSKFLDGPAGAQPPVGSYALPLLRELVNTVHMSTKDSQITPDDAIEVCSNSDNDDHANKDATVRRSVQRKSTDPATADLASMAAFLKHIIPNNR